MRRKGLLCCKPYMPLGCHTPYMPLGVPTEAFVQQSRNILVYADPPRLHGCVAIADMWFKTTCEMRSMTALIVFQEHTCSMTAPRLSTVIIVYRSPEALAGMM